MIDLELMNTVLNRARDTITSVSMENQNTKEIYPADIRVDEALRWVDDPNNREDMATKIYPLSVVYSGDDPSISLAFTVGYLTAKFAAARNERIVVIEEKLTNDTLQKYLAFRARSRATKLRELADTYDNKGPDDEGL